MLTKKYAFFLLTVILFWLKTYFVYLTQFNLGVNDKMQQFLLFLNPVSSALLFFGIAVIFKGRLQQWLLIIINFVLSFWLYANIVYYRFFSDFITFSTMTQSTGNAGDLGGSVASLMNGYDVFFFIDTLIVFSLVLFKIARPSAERWSVRTIFTVFVSAVMIFIVNLSLAETDRPELLSRTFDRNYIVKYLGAYNFAIYDTIQNARSNAQRAMADSSDINDIQNFTKSNFAAPNPNYYAKAKGMNVIYVSLESLQSFAINYKMPNGQEVTPFLNKLTTGADDTTYFKNFYHQTGSGKTSDAEFMMENSLFPLSQGPVFQMKGFNTYQAAPAMMNQRGYETAVFHGNVKSFWNRDQMYKTLGYERFFDSKYYDMSAENTKNYGMKDKPFIKETLPYLSNLKQPFYSKLILLSNHFPFGMDKEDTTFQPGDFGDSVVDNYFQSANYMDQAVEQLFTDLKKAGLFDNTVIIMYGDHYGLSENHNDAMAKVLGKDEITPFDNAQLQKVPLFIHIPKIAGGTVSTYGGEVDVRPTLMSLLGINTKNYIQFGTDLFSKQHRQIIPFRNGDVITNKYSIVGGNVYENSDGKQVEASLGKPYEDIAKKMLDYSDKVIYGDLLRFYQPKGFIAPDVSKINYNTDQKIPPDSNYGISSDETKK
ncbi:LTA synthase family protein [Sporolactobacillus shoreicorticis]|uniref:LTA synthase family protein n=1 Tax=Sporolactobacillus shoreicorticis TaxID=1923877 RepID=UPI002097FAC4|nr:LTA synthase family protein [Sporolactobacillus shoreicorticis]MCO7126229.1 LTA synthase family protein [Sporolactobacillus shoreicorticis]